MGAIAVTGSVAYDTIMVFPGHFAEHILPGKAHMLNVSFLVDRLERRPGGTGANIAWTLALLGERPLLCAAVGNDFGEYRAFLEREGVDMRSILACDDLVTATCFITTDLDDNQITAFYPGAMARAASVDLRALAALAGGLGHVVVAPDAPDAMEAHIEQTVALGAQLAFAPAQQLPAIGDEALRAGLDAAWMVVGNDYELELIRDRTGLDVEELGRKRMVAVTRGGIGSELHSPEGKVVIPPAPPGEVVDPTGAGDAYLAGLLAGLRRGHGPEVAGRVGALAATYVIEVRGPQCPPYSRGEFAARFRTAFGRDLEW